ncbi:glycoside hydrolase family 2 TIM barrel-domain containing protein [Prevotella sp. P6B4]|uniref:glycoside hydrolase family 2 TIM barrel-domain containing protein n=1 Tax=Prevotella sp. P6B4 TaxID=1410614 RepID=UPI00048EA919|nr:glycoside hydrolase family 2 TIM barrel-domain containing protein [Prevotella sp. P6B4]
MKQQLLSWLLAVPLAVGAQQRQELTLTDNWQFSHDKLSWQDVSVPHDWAIAGPFDKKWDLQTVAIVQNGETEATEKSGRSGALPWIGKGYYKRTFTIPKDCPHAELVFDGAMAEPHVYINGKEAAFWAYGYNTFRVDITPYMKAGDNLLEVDLQNLEESSRWYPGAGIYRPVKLVLTGEDWIDPWKTFIRTRSLRFGDAKLDITVGTGSPADTDFLFEVEIYDREGNMVAKGISNKVGSMGTADMSITVENAKLWTPETPYLYTARIKYLENGQVLDATTQKFGIRTVKVSKDGGFQLNGQTRKIKGVCLHHDLGPLGAAVNKAALIRQIKTMKEMGCDAIRTSHNMPSQMQMDICDSLGMMVMAESFDMWIYPKCKNGYARFFEEWCYRDVENLVLANRNHPSIVMWSIGNEIPEQGSEDGAEISEYLQDICHSLDPTRPVTQGLDHAEKSIESGVAKLMDIPGFNYRVHKYKNSIQQLPQGFLLGSETASTVSSRGIYKFPVEPDDNARYASWAPGYDPKAIEKADGQCSSYDLEYCPWSNLPDDDWAMQDDYPWVIGEFVWTGYDYLGEPSPYDEYWPARSSYFGICDLAGLPKDRYYLYRSHWNQKQHTIHLLPHWSFGRERIGQITPVYCYTDYPTAELFVNGKSQGKITKDPTSRLDRYRLRWNHVRYQPGSLKVVVYDADGKRVGEKTIRTANKPAVLKLDVWTQHNQATSNEGFQLNADGEDMAFVTVSLTDSRGTLVPQADDQLTFQVTGAGTFEAVCNGDATSLESFKQPTMKLFNGQLVVVVRAAKQSGTVTLKVMDKKRGISKSIQLKVG